MTDTTRSTQASATGDVPLRTAVHEVTVVFRDETRQHSTYASRELAVASAERMAAGEFPEIVARVGKPISRIEIQSREAIHLMQRRGVGLA